MSSSASTAGRRDGREQAGRAWACRSRASWSSAGEESSRLGIVRTGPEHGPYSNWATERGGGGVMSEHPRAGTAGWVLIALAGLAIAVLLSVAASNLSTQPIGLEGEPLRAGERLAPATPQQRAAATTPKKSRSRSTTRTQTTPPATAPQVPRPATTATSTIPAPRTDDHGGGDPDHDDD